MFDLTKVSEQLSRQLGELLEAIFQGGIVQQRHIATDDLRNFSVQFVPAFS